MTHTLISFLGKGHPDRGRRYRQATYDFGAGRLRKTEFFGLALTEEIRPDQLLVLGTTGSMWDVLLVSLDLGEAHEDALLQLTESADADCVTQSELDTLAPVVSERLGLSVVLRLIPYGRDTQEQLNILHCISSDLRPGDEATLDITHGFRHLPMLTQLSALYLRTAARVDIKGIYYGALEMTPADGPTPVMNLDGLLRIADWIGALHTFDKDGDYGVFTELLEDELEPEIRALLRDAAFYEQTSRVGRARGKLRNFETALEKAHLHGIGKLFEPTLKERIGWHHQGRLYQRQQALARQHLARADYLRAALYGFEAFITRLVQRTGGNPDKFEDRNDSKEAYENANKGFKSSEFQNYRLLRDLRNQLAHGNTPPRAEVQSAMANADALQQTLSDLSDALLPVE